MIFLSDKLMGGKSTFSQFFLHCGSSAVKETITETSTVTTSVTDTSTMTLADIRRNGDVVLLWNF